jgi:alanine dehydrogenase
MDIAIPKEARPREHRVALSPSGVRTLVQRGHRVWVEKDAGLAAGHPTANYEAAGAQIAYSRQEVFARGQLVPTVWAPDPREYGDLHADQVVFGFWGLPASRPEEFRALAASEVTAIGIEAIEDDAGRAPVRTSMSEIAGSLAVVLGSGLLLNDFGGKGILLGGVPGAPPANFVVLGAGVLGRAAARAALGLGAHVTLLDVSLGHLREAAEHLPAGVTTMLATQPNVEKALGFADLVLGAVAVHAQRAPVIVTRAMLKLMKPRTVVVDLAIDMGGCFETSRPTSLSSPTYEVDGILHMCVPNLPSSAARTATLALTGATLPYLQAVADGGIDAALAEYPELVRGTYLYRGRCASAELARVFDVAYCAPGPGVEVAR